MNLNVIKADIATLVVDAIVNAANSELLPGGGVCGAIHHAAGASVADECARFIRRNGRPLNVGDAIASTAGRLPCGYIIHAVGPIYSRTGSMAPDLLAMAYRNALVTANALALHTIAFPCISTGVYGYPADEACRIAVTTCREWNRPGLTECTFCVFSEADLDRYTREIGAP